MCEVQAGGTALGQGAVCNGCHQCRGKVGRKIGPSREGREEKHSKISVWFIEDSHKTWSDKGFTMALMWGDHLEQLSHSNLSLPSLNHDTGHHQEKAKASHTVLGPYSCHHGHAPLSPRPADLHSPHAPLGALLHSLLLSIALACHSEGHSVELRNKGMVSVSEKKEQETNALSIQFLCSYCCNSQQL